MVKMVSHNGLEKKQIKRRSFYWSENKIKHT